MSEALVAAAIALITDVLRAVAAAKEQDHAALLAKLGDARAALASARADALGARAEGAAALKALDEEPKVKPPGDEEPK